ncbi:MAG TPA: hypothetical protein VM487_20515, partial [Phycisphaerae bacterium]|nr:hypothetical protein [Phycisphaerae bacterium]
MKARLALLFSVLFCATALAADLSFEAKVDKFLGGINAATTKPSPAKLAKIATACVKKGLMLRAKEVAALVKKDTQAAKTLSVMIEANTSILGKWQIADDTLPPYHIVCRANGTVYAHTPDNPHAPWR